MELCGADHARRDLGGVALSELDLDGACVELAGDQDLIRDPREPHRLGLDHLEEDGVVLVVQHQILAPQRSNRAVDRRERGAQLVRGRGDEVAARFLQGLLVRDVT